MEKIGSLLASECFRRRPSFSRKRSEKFACVVIICHVAHGAEAALGFTRVFSVSGRSALDDGGGLLGFFLTAYLSKQPY